MTRRALVLVAILAVPAAVARAQPAGLKQYECAYYVIHTDLDRDAAREAEIRMTRMAEEYHARTREFAGAIKTKFPFYLFKNERDYRRAGGTAGSAGLFDPNTGTLMAVAGERMTLQTWHIVQHEGFHQFASVVIGGELPIWANEGLAEYFGEAVFTGDSFVAGVVPQWRLKRIRETFDAGGFKPMRELMLMSHAQWNDGLSLTNYDQAWTMAHFLVHADGGAYQRRFAGFIRGVANRQPWEQAWLDNIGPADGFEAKWRAYWKKLPDNPTGDLFAEATLRTLTSFLARATAQGQKFGDFDAFFTAAQKGELKTSEANWLPPSLLEGAVAQAEGFRRAGGSFSLVTIKPRPPQLVYEPKRGGKMTGRFTLEQGRVASVTVDRRR